MKDTTVLLTSALSDCVLCSNSRSNRILKLQNTDDRTTIQLNVVSNIIIEVGSAFSSL